MSRLSSTIDSFEFLWQQIERDARNLFHDTRDILAIVGLLYTARKVFSITCNLAEAVYVHLLGQPQTDWPKKFGPWAVVTGSSEGIGFSYAQELAQRDLNIVLISRNERKLLKAKSIIEKESQVTVEYIVADFGTDDQKELYRKIWEKLADKDIGLLVNNVGVMYDYPDVLLKIPSQKLWQMININIGAATMLTHMLLPQMVERGKGGVIVVSSGSSTQITPQMTVYSATKRYLDYFIHGLAYEYRHSGVIFQCLIPFYTATRMTGYSSESVKSGVIIPSAQTYARQAVTTLGKSACTTGYFPHTLQLWMSQCVPLWLWMWGTEKLNNSIRKQALNRLANKMSKSSSGSSVEEASRNS